jgi:hypothetical protein
MGTSRLITLNLTFIQYQGTLKCIQHFAYHRHVLHQKIGVADDNISIYLLLREHQNPFTLFSFQYCLMKYHEKKREWKNLIKVSSINKFYYITKCNGK